MNVGFSCFSSGPLHDLTPKDESSIHQIGVTDSPFQMSPFGPPYEIPITEDAEVIGRSVAANKHK